MLPSELRFINSLEVLEIAKEEAQEYLLRPAEADFMETSDRAAYLYHLTSYIEANNKIKGLEKSKALVQYYDPTLSTASIDDEIHKLMTQIMMHINAMEAIIEKVRG